MTATLAERDGQLINGWYIACLSKELTHKPMQRTLYDRPIVLFRDGQGKAGCLPDRCLHRAALLSEGEIRNGRLACPYHGWEYNKDGQVERIPSEDPASIKGRSLCHKALAVCEQDGVIWVWTGENPPRNDQTPWRFPFANDPQWEHYFMITDFPNEVTNLAENFMDVPHTVYVHRGWFRDEQATRKPIPTTVDTKNGRVLVTYFQEKDEFSWGARFLLNPKGHPMKHTDEFIYPNVTRVDYWFGDNGFIINSQCSPVSTMKSRVYTYIGYKIPRFKKLLKPIFRFYTRQVIEQDVQIMRNQGTSLTYDSRTNFRSTECDEVHVAIERLRHMGVRGDVKLFEFESHKKIHFWI